MVLLHEIVDSAEDLLSVLLCGRCGVEACVVWCGVVWCGVVWCGVDGVVWCGVV